jgi:hypothetical protein
MAVRRPREVGNRHGSIEAFRYASQINFWSGLIFTQFNHIYVSQLLNPDSTAKFTVILEIRR